MRGPGYVECPEEPLPSVEGIAIVASTREAKFVPVEVEKNHDGTSWRSLVLAREGSPNERIEIRAVRESPLILEVKYSTNTKCGPIEFHLAMETHGRTLSKSEIA